MADELIRLDTTIIGIDSLINKASTAEEAKVLFMAKDVIYSQQKYFTDAQPVIHAHWRRGEEKGFKTYNCLWYCSNCGGQIRYDTRMRQYQKIKCPVWEVNAFCRKCGARMDGENT